VVYPGSFGVAAFAKVLTTREGYGPPWAVTVIGCWCFACLCKGFVASLCNHTSEVWYDAWPASHGWVQSSSELLRELWWKCTTCAEWKPIDQPCSRTRAAWILTW
jgi:hypothetical protein